MEFDNYCSALPLDIVMPEDDDDNASSDVNFVVEIEASHTYVPHSMLEDDSSDLRLFDNLESEAFRKTFKVKRDAILHQTTSTATVSDMLFEVGVPLGIQEFMIQRILGCANDMARQKRYAGRKVLRMRVTAEVTQFVDDDFVLGLAVDDRVCGLVPASESSIEALEKVEIEQGTGETCSICLEELIGGAAAARMPCMHLFDQNCIVNWLHRNNFCPLCRFKLPARE
ncbi:uncharacterized protein LOC132169682 [Corylus avellana]|uniref:uncharacterized protein LOC132169682 n=1 Tax=Corylus avellana TaxID=13451 RepID=UPI00286CD6C3|nr:uncharacterized protein LOC132169682 [Corylus avellana]